MTIGRLARVLAVVSLAAIGAARLGAGPGEEGEDWNRWLDEVAPHMSHAERVAFESLSRNYQRRAFAERFWEVRDPYPHTTRNEARERWRELVTVATQLYGRLDDDRAAVLVVHGEPDWVANTSCHPGLPTLELWRLGADQYLEQPVVVAFAPETGSDLWRQWRALGAVDELSDPDEADLEPFVDQIRAGCLDEATTRRLMGAAIDSVQLGEMTDRSLHPEPEWVTTFVRHTTDLPPSSRPLAGELAINFHGRRQSRTAVQALITVDPAPLLAIAATEVLVDGDVLRGDELFESFHYRFDLGPPDAATGGFPLVVERALRPGPYTLVLRARDPTSRLAYREKRDIEVPWVDATAPAMRVAGAEPSGSATRSAPEEVSIRLQSPPERLLTGKVRLGAIVRGEGVERVLFELDGRRILTKRHPPYGVELDLGRAPRLHRVRVVALGPNGGELADDEVAVNGGPHRFSVRLVEPTGRAGERLTAHAVVEAPRGDRLDRVELYIEDERLVSLYEPPFVHPLPPLEPPTFVRALAVLESGAQAEDLVFFGPGGPVDSLDVHLVELFTSVVDRKGRPVPGLGPEAFRIVAEKQEQPILRFETVDTMPIHAAVVIDTSTSMLSQLRVAEQAALGFFKGLLTTQDRACVITFADQPRLVVPFTGDVELLAGGLHDLVAEGETALWDALSEALFQLAGVSGKRVVVLLSDGGDSASRFRFQEILEFARHSGVAIYPIGIDLRRDDDRQKASLNRLARETGGRAFFISGLYRLQRIYEEIESEIRSQYLLVFQADVDSSDEGEFHEVRIEMATSGLEARTIAGYYR